MKASKSTQGVHLHDTIMLRGALAVIHALIDPLEIAATAARGDADVQTLRLWLFAIGRELAQLELTKRLPDDIEELGLSWSRVAHFARQADEELGRIADESPERNALHLALVVIDDQCTNMINRLALEATSPPERRAPAPAAETHQAAWARVKAEPQAIAHRRPIKLQ
jgi:hypothetical protein